MEMGAGVEVRKPKALTGSVERTDVFPEICVELCSICHLQVVGCRYMEGTGNVDPCIGAEHKTVWVHEVQVCPWDDGRDAAIDGRRGTPGNAADNISDGARCPGVREQGQFSGSYVELSEAMEKVGPSLSAHVCVYRVYRATQGVSPSTGYSAAVKTNSG